MQPLSCIRICHYIKILVHHRRVMWWLWKLMASFGQHSEVISAAHKTPTPQLMHAEQRRRPVLGNCYLTKQSCAYKTLMEPRMQAITSKWFSVQHVSLARTHTWPPGKERIRRQASLATASDAIVQNLVSVPKQRRWSVT